MDLGGGGFGWVRSNGPWFRIDGVLVELAVMLLPQVMIGVARVVEKDRR